MSQEYLSHKKLSQPSLTMLMNCDNIYVNYLSATVDLIPLKPILTGKTVIIWYIEAFHFHSSDHYELTTLG